MTNKGFTLAEVLITLLIIGVVAALTIPSVISNYQQMEFKTGLKKVVSVLNSAIQTNIAQDGETPYENEHLFLYLQRHMSVLKSINTVSRCYNKNTYEEYDYEASGDGLCKSGYSDKDSAVLHNQVFYTTDGMRFEIPWAMPDNRLKLHESNTYLNSYKYKDGTVIRDGWCGSYGLSDNNNNTEFTPCLVMVDVNGDKKPNAMEITVNQNWSDGGYNSKGLYTYPKPADKKLQDTFTIMITDEKAIPYGVVAQRAMYSK